MGAKYEMGARVETAREAGSPRRDGASLISGVQYLRGLAALLVVFAHTNGMMGHPEYFGQRPFPLKESGGFGVAVFFVISGFIIVAVSIKPNGEPALTPREFALRRFLRIVPFMWACTVGYNLFTYLGTHTMEWGPFLRALVLWPIGDLKPNVLWSLRHEIIFYCLFALCMLRPRRLVPLLAAWCLCPLILGLFGVTAQTLKLSSSALTDLVQVVGLGGLHAANLQFGAGALLGLALIKSHALVQRRLPIGPWTIATLTVACAALVEMYDRAMGFSALGMLVWTALAAFVVWVGVVMRPKPGYGDRLWRLLGDASYSIYLLHNVPLLVALELGVGHQWPKLFFGIAVVAALTTGVVAHLLIEKPLTTFLAQRFKRRSSGAELHAR